MPEKKKNHSKPVTIGSVPFSSFVSQHLRKMNSSVSGEKDTRSPRNSFSEEPLR